MLRMRSASLKMQFTKLFNVCCNHVLFILYRISLFQQTLNNFVIFFSPNLQRFIHVKNAFKGYFFRRILLKKRLFLLKWALTLSLPFSEIDCTPDHHSVIKSALFYHFFSLNGRIDIWLGFKIPPAETPSIGKYLPAKYI